MLKHAIAAMFLFLLLVSVGQSQTPTLSLEDVDVVIESGSALATVPQQDVVVEGTEFLADEVAGDCNCQSDTACSQGCGHGCSHNARPSWTDMNCYYRSVRQSFDRGPCCGDYFGGFGPLWESYCADRLYGCFGKGCSSSACSTSDCTARKWRPLCGICRGRGCAHCDACAVTVDSCDCAGPNAGVITESPTTDIGAPPEVAPPQAAEPTAQTPQTEFPVSSERQTSSRRGWVRPQLRWSDQG